MKQGGLLSMLDRGVNRVLPAPYPQSWVQAARARKTEQVAAEIRQRKEQERQRQYDEALSAVMDLRAVPIQINRYVTVTMSDRWAIAGMSGSGKTTWAKQLIPRMFEWYQCPIYILDSKGEGIYDDIANEINVLQDAPAALKEPRIFVWKPPLDVLDEYDLWLQNILKARQPGVVLIDELANLGRGNAQSYVTNYQLLLKQGRSLKLSTISMTQDLAYIPRQTMGQTTHFLRFLLQNPQDIRNAAALLGLPDDSRRLQPPYPYGFFYKRVDRPSPVVSFENWQTFFSNV